MFHTECFLSAPIRNKSESVLFQCCICLYTYKIYCIVVYNELGYNENLDARTYFNSQMYVLHLNWPIRNILSGNVPRLSFTIRETEITEKNHMVRTQCTSSYHNFLDVFQYYTCIFIRTLIVIYQNCQIHVHVFISEVTNCMRLTIILTIPSSHSSLGLRSGFIGMFFTL